MPQLIDSPTIIQAAGNKPKRIEEFLGRVNSQHEHVSIARMTSPEGWVEPGQRPEFQEFTLVLSGAVYVDFEKSESKERGQIVVRAGQAFVAEPGEWVRYSTPEAGGATYVAVCLPAFSPQTVHRDAEESAA